MASFTLPHMGYGLYFFGNDPEKTLRLSRPGASYRTSVEV